MINRKSLITLTMQAMLLMVCILALVLTTQSFSSGGSRRSRSSSLSMLFGMKKKTGGGKGGAITIKVDGKTINAEGKNLNLRKVCQDNKIDVYPLKTKISGNCGGAGICGKCAVKVISGEKNISKMSKNEENTLSGKPADFRLSCCAKVSGPIEVKSRVA